MSYKILICPSPKAEGGPGIFISSLLRDFRKRGYVVTTNPLGSWDVALVNLSGKRVRLLGFLKGSRKVVFRSAGWYIPEVFQRLNRRWLSIYDKINVDTAYALNNSDVVIYQSKWAKQSLDRLAKQEGEWRIIWNGTDITHFRPLPVTKSGKSKLVTLGSVGKIRLERLATLARLSKLLDFPHKFLVVGYVVDEIANDLARIEGDPVLRERFEFAGLIPHEELPAWYNKMDCLVHPIPGDSCPNTVIEALACGIPVVTLGEGGAAELVGDAGIDVPGSLTDFSDDRLEEIVEAIRKVLASRTLYTSRARNRAVNYFNIVEVAAQYLEAMGLPPYVPRRSIMQTVHMMLGTTIQSVVAKHSRPRAQKPVIAYILLDWYMGGMASWTYRLASALKDEYDFHFLATSLNEFDPKFRKFGKCVYLPDFIAMWRYLKSHKVDLVQTACQRWPIDAARAAGVPYIIERTDGTRSCCAVPKEGLDLIIASSKQTAEYIRKIAPDIPIEVIYNSVDLNEIDRAPANKECSDGSLVIGRACRIGRGKRLDLLIEACSLLPKKLAYQLVIVGGESRLKGADRGVVDELKKLVHVPGVNAVFIGERSNPIPDIKGFDIGTCVSDPYNEGIPNSLIESMAAGQPVVATNVDQVSELVEDGYNGFLVPPGDSAALSQALAKLLRDPDLRAAFGAKARQTIESKFSMEESVARYHCIYQELLAQ
jgi:glycosyltransferase involved in cell wall biosynthesis